MLWTFACVHTHIASLRGVGPWVRALRLGPSAPLGDLCQQLESKQQIWVEMMTAAHRSHSATAGPPAGHLNCRGGWGAVSGGGSSDGPSLALQHPNEWPSLGSVGLGLLWTKSRSWVEVNLWWKGLSLLSPSWKLWCKTNHTVKQSKKHCSHKEGLNPSWKKMFCWWDWTWNALVGSPASVC